MRNANAGYYNGLCIVQRNDKYGYIDKQGNIKISLKYDDVYHFSEGLACVMTTYPGKYGYINTQGTFIIPQFFEQASIFSEGFAAVRVNGKWGYIKKPF